MNLAEQIARVNKATEYASQALKEMMVAWSEMESLTLEQRALDEAMGYINECGSVLLRLRRTLERRRDEIAAGR